MPGGAKKFLPSTSLVRHRMEHLLWAQGENSVYLLNISLYFIFAFIYFIFAFIYFIFANPPPSSSSTAREELLQ